MPIDATVLICTHNRAGLLADTLDSLAVSLADASRRTGPPLACEVVVVDNHSHDDTVDVVQARIGRFPRPLRLVAEPRLGKSHALNTGISAAAGDIILFTDDDVQVPAGWVGAAVQPLRTRSDIDYTGGPVRPLWQVQPPAWIDGDRGLLWGPIALLDYGPEPFIFEERRRIALGVNMAARRSLIDRVGSFHPALERRGDSLMGQGQAEFFFRTRAAGARGLYVPEMWLQHHVPAWRLTRQYYRRWWYWKGVARAQLEHLHPVTELGLDLTAVPTFWNLPRFMWGGMLRAAAGWLGAGLDGHLVRQVEAEMTLAYLAGYLRARRGLSRAEAPGRVSPAAPCPPGSSVEAGP